MEHPLFAGAQHQHAASLRAILQDLGYPQPPIIIMCDNTCAIGIATDSIKQKRAKVNSVYLTSNQRIT